MMNKFKTRQRANRERRQKEERGRRRGVAMLVMALSTVFIFGCASLAVDYGLLVNDKNKMQFGADAAALAGAYELGATGDDATDTAKARQVAIDVARENGVTVTADKVTFLEDNEKIRVEAVNTRNLYFAKVVGIPTGQVNVAATAKVKNPGLDPAVVPIGITRETHELYTKPILTTAPIPLTLPRVVDSIYSLNNFLVFDLRDGGKSAPHMKTQLMYGYGDTNVGDMLTSLNASVTGAPLSNFRDALAYRFQQAAQPPWNDTWTGSVTNSTGIRYTEIIKGTARTDNPRVMSLVVNPSGGPSNGTTKHEVLATTPVYIESWDDNALVVRFLPSVVGSGSTISTRSVSLVQ